MLALKSKAIPKIVRPRYIALVGYESSSKLMVQRILARIYNIVPIDIADIVNRLVVKDIGALPTDIYTGSGAKQPAVWGDGSPVVNRETGLAMSWGQVAWEIGRKLEELLGPDALPLIATARTNSKLVYSFVSVKDKQGWFFKERGGIVVEVAGGFPTGSAFDSWDATSVTFSIRDVGSPGDLRSEVVRLFDSILDPFSFDVC